MDYPNGPLTPQPPQPATFEPLVAVPESKNVQDSESCGRPVKKNVIELFRAPCCKVKVEDFHVVLTVLSSRRARTSLLGFAPVA